MTLAQDIAEGRTALGIELGSTRIKACLIDESHAVLATGSHAWENSLADGLWTYSLDEVWAGLQACVADLLRDAQGKHGVAPERFGSLGISAMMHGYLAFDASGELLAPFRTWRNTNTEVAAGELTELFDFNIPLRWSIAHYYQAVVDAEPHVGEVDYFTTLAGYVHWRLTGEKVLGVGDASGMFPIDDATRDWDEARLAQFDARAEGRGADRPVRELMPQVLVAGEPAGVLTEEGARLLDPSGTLQAGIPLCPPEGDAGTGMVATNSVRPRTGNVSAGTSIFAMVVLEKPLESVHLEIDNVTTPAGDQVAMVHCNNGASELGEWVDTYRELVAALGHEVSADEAYGAFFRAALDGEADGGGILAYNYLAGEPITGLGAGRPLVVRTPSSRFSLANFARSQIYGVFGTLALGMKVLDAEGVALDEMFAHGGLFRTEGVAQRFLAAALEAPVSVSQTASEGGAWGIAVLAAFSQAVGGGSGNAGGEVTLADYLADRVFADIELDVAEPDAADVEGFRRYLTVYENGLAAVRAAVESV